MRKVLYTGICRHARSTAAILLLAALLPTLSRSAPSTMPPRAPTTGSSPSLILVAKSAEIMLPSALRTVIAAFAHAAPPRTSSRPARS